MRPNKLVERLEKGDVVFGTLVSNGDCDDLDALAESDYDFAILEMEHMGFDFPTLTNSLFRLLSRRRIAQKGNVQPDVVPLVRVPCNAGEMNQWVIKQTLDAGAYGIVMPHVSSVEEARAVVAAMRYPARAEVKDPTARVRGWSPTPAPRYWGLSPLEYFDAADVWPINPRGNLFLLAIVEDREGVNNLPEILREVRGISAVWAGTGDLSVSLGYPGNARHPIVEDGVQRILKACLDGGVPCCIPAASADVAQRIDQGFKVILAMHRRSFESLEHGRKVAQSKTSSAL